MGASDPPAPAPLSPPWGAGEAPRATQARAPPAAVEFRNLYVGLRTPEWLEEGWCPPRQDAQSRDQVPGAARTGMTQGGAPRSLHTGRPQPSLRWPWFPPATRRRKRGLPPNTPPTGASGAVPGRQAHSWVVSPVGRQVPPFWQGEGLQGT